MPKCSLAIAACAIAADVELQRAIGALEQRSLRSKAQRQPRNLTVIANKGCLSHGTHVCCTGNTIDAIAPGPGGVTSGVPLLIGNLFGVPEVTAAAGETFALNVVGVHSCPRQQAARLSLARLPTGQ